MGAGRPPKPEAERQRHSVASTFTDGEIGELEKAAEGEPLGAFVRRIVLRYLARRRRR